MKGHDCHWVGRGGGGGTRRHLHHQRLQQSSASRILIVSITTILPFLHLLLPCIAIATSELDNEAVLKTDQKRGGAHPFVFAPDEKRGGARSFNFAPNEKRAGARAFHFAQNEKRAGGRAFSSGTEVEKRSAGLDRQEKDYNEEMLLTNTDELKRAGARVFQLDDSSDDSRQKYNFAPDEKKRGGARPFYGGGYMDGAWKRAGGRYFMSHFDDSPFTGWVKRGGGHRFSSLSSLIKRGGGRSFFGGVDALFNPANYWSSQQFVRPIGDYPRRSLFENFGRKRAGARAFNRFGGIDTLEWEKRAGGRRFSEQLSGEER